MIREDGVSKIFILISLLSEGFGNDFSHIEQLQISNAHQKQITSQFEICKANVKGDSSHLHRASFLSIIYGVI